MILKYFAIFYSDVGFEHVDYNSPCTPVESYNFSPTIYDYGYVY